jgi:TusA-related sulfurtransferase
MGMKEAGMKLQQGEMLPLCGSCTAFGGLMMKGVTQEYAETKHGDVWIVTSDDDEVAAEIQAWAKRNREELAKMKSQEG